MNDTQKPVSAKSRRSLIAGLGILSLFPLVKSAFSFKKKDTVSCGPEVKGPVKMLTQDGRLVEVDPSKISANRKKASNEEMKSWVKKDI